GERGERVPGVRALARRHRHRRDRRPQGLADPLAARSRGERSRLPAHRSVLRLSPPDGRAAPQRYPGQAPLRRQSGRRHGPAQGRTRRRRRGERRRDARLRPARERGLPHALELGQVREPRAVRSSLRPGRHRQGRARRVSQDGRRPRGLEGSDGERRSPESRGSAEVRRGAGQRVRQHPEVLPNHPGEGRAPVVKFSLGGLGRGNLTLTARLVLGSGLALLACGAALLYSILRGEIADQRTALREQLREEMSFALPAMSGPAVVGDYSVIEQMVKARARQPTIARFAWTDNFGHLVAAPGPALPIEAPGWFVARLRLPLLEDSKPVVVGGEKYGMVSLELNPAVSVNKLWRGFWEKLGILVLGTALSLGVTLVVLRSGVQPLRTLAASARRFGQGEYTVRILAEGPPETAQCIQAFNSRAGNIESLLGSLRLSEEKNRLLALQVEQSSDAIFSHDQRGIVTTWNRGASRLYGYSAAEAIGRSLRELDLWDGPGVQP